MNPNHDFVYCSVNNSSTLPILPNEKNRPTCALCCIAMVLYKEGKISKEQVVNIDWLIALAISLHKDGVIPVLQRQIEICGMKLWMTESHIINKQISEILKACSTNDKRIFVGDQSTFFPVYNNISGYDHRASRYLFSLWGMNADVAEGLDWNRLSSHFKEENRYSLLSLNNAKDINIPEYRSPIGNHVVLAFGMDSEGRIKVIDPNSKNDEYLEYSIDKNYFDTSFNKFGTLIG